LFTAAVHRLVEVNLEAMWQELAAAPTDTDPVTRGIWVLRRASRRAPFGAELELWGAARTDAQLRSALREAERGARRQLHDVIDAVFGPEIAAAGCYPLVMNLTVQLIRGLTISASLHEQAKQHEPLVDQWAQVVRALLANDMTDPSASNNVEKEID
jgi:hypothetical protein